MRPGADCRSELRCELDGLGGTCQMAGAGDVGASCASGADCLAGLACTAGGMCDRASEAFPPFPGITCGADESPFRGYFEIPRPSRRLADFYRLPFPNDARIKADGTLDLSDFPRPGQTALGVDLVALYADAAEADFAGFASISVASFRFSSPLDFSTVADGAAVFLVDITTPGAPGFAPTAAASSATTGRGKFACQNRFTLGNRTTDALEPGHTYAAWISTAARSATGAVPTQDADLIAMLAATPPTDPDLMRAWDQYAKFRAYLAADSRAADTVATVAMFTVADASAQARALAAQVAARAAPPSPISRCATARPRRRARPPTIPPAPAATSSGGFWEPRVGAGGAELPGRHLPYERPVDGGAIAVDGAGAPMVQGELPVCFAMTIPKGMMPSGGWPVVVAHGTGGNYRSAIGNGIAERLAPRQPDVQHRQPAGGARQPPAGCGRRHDRAAPRRRDRADRADGGPVPARPGAHVLLRPLAGQQRRHPGARGQRPRPGGDLLRAPARC
ncbi:MAG: hypothetical protein IPL61_06670 [Myxococcales bacterium]|nr:hypothetical protein [Myxococcales bacterium]